MSYFLKTTLFLYSIFSIVISQGFAMQEEKFGKNIVQYHQFDWHYIETQHFDIYYYDSLKKQAEFVAYHAEEGYEKIEILVQFFFLSIQNSNNHDFLLNNVFQYLHYLMIPILQ